MLFLGAIDLSAIRLSIAELIKPYCLIIPIIRCQTPQPAREGQLTGAVKGSKERRINRAAPFRADTRQDLSDRSPKGAVRPVREP